MWEEARHVPGSSVESKGGSVPRVLYSNIKDLLIEHRHIDAEDLDRWHEWAEPGAVIVFDEVQEVWRPRGLGVKTPPAIAALETHRHKGVDIVLITQHPMLVDPNIRRLVNRHLHLRRLTKTIAMVYEWDHCENPGQTRSALTSRLWRHPKAAYELYKSAQLHTKPTARLPRALLGLLAALGALAVAGPFAWGRVTASFGGGPASAAPPASSAVVRVTPPASSTVPLPIPPASSPVPAPAAPASAPVAAVFSGCYVHPARGCRCFDTSGRPVPQDEAMCQDVGAVRAVVEVPEALQEVPRPVPSSSEGDAEVFNFMLSNRGTRGAV